VILQELKIELARWGEQKGKHVGTATFAGEAGSVTLNLNDHHLEEIFRTCADSIIETSRAAARHLTMNVIEHQKALPGETK
jgi:hypothetical protein